MFELFITIGRFSGSDSLHIFLPDISNDSLLGICEEWVKRTPNASHMGTQVLFTI